PSNEACSVGSAHSNRRWDHMMKQHSLRFSVIARFTGAVALTLPVACDAPSSAAATNRLNEDASSPQTNSQGGDPSQGGADALSKSSAGKGSGKGGNNGKSQAGAGGTTSSRGSGGSSPAGSGGSSPAGSGGSSTTGSGGSSTTGSGGSPTTGSGGKANG